MARIPQPFIDDLLDRIDIVDVVSARIDLRKSGKNYSARCPFHDEKTPSFSVSPDKQFFYCFGCGAGGNAIGFVMDHDHVNFPEAVETLARQCGMDVPKEEPRDAAADSQRRKLYAILGEADRYYRQQLKHHPEAKIPIDYLKKRGLSGEISRTFGIGFAPPGWDNLINRLCHNDEDVGLLMEAGLVIRKEDSNNRVYDRFRNRIIFPIRDTRGRTIGFGGRVLDDSKPKYLNSPETAVYHKGRELYGLYEAHKALGEIRALMVVEGYMDVVALAQHGIHNTVATLGTAATTDHLEKLFRYTSDVIFCFDGDEAGRRAALRAMETCLPVMEDGKSARFLFLPEGEDPDTLVRKLGKDGFNKLIDCAQPLSEFLFANLQQNIDTSTMDGKARLSQLAAPLINRIPRGVFYQLMLKELAKRTDMDTDSLAAIIAPPTKPDASPLEGETTNSLPGDYANYADFPDADSAPYDRGDYDDYSGNDLHFEPSNRQPGASQGITTTTARRLKLSPLRRLILMLLHMPELRLKLESMEGLAALDDPDAEMLVDLCALLDENPHYTLNHILGYWRGIYGADKGEALARIAAADMFIATALPLRDNLGEFMDLCRHLQDEIESNKPPRQRLEAILAKPNLDANDRKQITRLQSLLTNEEKNELYQLIKQALTSAAGKKLKPDLPLK
ncbi:MAG: DNA primase [Porticoccaceae bacterium]|nr:DNA primase [Porticoccaceae bacterium]